MATYGSNGTVFPIVNRLASATAKVEWKLYRKSASGNDEDRTEITNHAVLDLINRPNRFMSRMQLMEAGQQHNDLVGETNLAVGYVGGVKIPVDLWPIRADRIAPVPDPYEYLKGWIYTGPQREQIPLELKELLRFIQPNPTDPYRGQGPIQSILADLDAQRYGQEWQAAFFANSARPGGIIEVDRHLADPEFDEMRERWNEQHRGVSKAHRVALLENGAKWVDTAAFTQRDMQMAELSNVGRDTVLIAYGYPKSMLGIVEDVNRANAEAGEYMFGKWLVEPRLDRWKGMFNTQLLPLYGETAARTLELDYESPVPENSELAMSELEKKSTALVALTGSGFDATEVLDFLGWPNLKYTAPPPPTVVAPPAPPGQEEPPAKQPPRDAPAAGVDGAMRWVVKAHIDDNVCEPCEKNQGKTYRNRQSAYADYPGGKGYIKCVGAQYGNECRCTVVKRKGQ